MKKLIVAFLIPGIMWAQSSQGGGSILGILFPIIIMFAIFYFLLILPQSRAEKRRKEMLSKLKKGDRVVTTGGIIGTIQKVEENVVTLKIAQNTNIKIDKNAVRAVLSPKEETQG